MIDDAAKEDFQAAVRDYYKSHGRHDLPWRLPDANGYFDPYKILVSEVMLQQTQVTRVIPKYQQFLKRYPTALVLAEAQLGDVLRAWNGLGYNRRAKFLHQDARMLTDVYDGNFPTKQTELVKFPGIGVNTAGAILAYAFNEPISFLETNIRTVFIHHFFDDRVGIHDKEVIRLVERTLDYEHPREWYWALMDYGSYLKQIAGNLNRQSANYAKQSKFAGSRRQIRGQIIRLLSAETLTAAQLAGEIPDPRLYAVIEELLHEGLIFRKGARLAL